MAAASYGGAKLIVTGRGLSSDQKKHKPAEPSLRQLAEILSLKPTTLETRTG
jgi:hypothetical protein